MTKISMYEYTTKNYNKTGRLSKHAYPELSITTADTDSGDPTNYKEVAKSIRKSFTTIESISTPYMFTYIDIKADGKRYIVYQDAYVNGHKFMTSPTELLKALTQ